MTKVSQVKAAKGFTYSDAPQRSPEWIAGKVGKVGSSQLHRWLAVSKNPDKKTGLHTPLKARLDYERELAFERKFGVPFTHFVTGAMQAGIDNEDVVADSYSLAMGVPVEKCGMFYNDWFAISPDRLVGEDGLLEIKWLQDASFTEVLATGKPYCGTSGDHYLQIQGQLWGSGRKWCDYAVGNENTGKFTVIRVERDEETIKRIADSKPDDVSFEFAVESLFDLKTPEFAVTSGAVEELTIKEDW